MGVSRKTMRRSLPMALRAAALLRAASLITAALATAAMAFAQAPNAPPSAPIERRAALDAAAGVFSAPSGPVGGTVSPGTGSTPAKDPAAAESGSRERPRSDLTATDVLVAGGIAADGTAADGAAEGTAADVFAVGGAAKGGSTGDARPMTPQRVVSMNLCTDQLAMLLAAPGQLISVSALARDPLSSAMASEALDYGANHGLAEEIFLLRPDLVLTEPYTRPATVALLRQLGIKVVLIQPVEDLRQIGRALDEVGAALGREAAATAARQEFDRHLAELRSDLRPASAATANLGHAENASVAPAPPRAAIYQANGYTTGAQTLGGDILAAAGLANITDDLGLTWGGFLPLEQLVMTAPEVVISGQPYPGRSRAEDVLAHPALAALRHGKVTATARDADWICGTPHVLRAVRAMRDLRHQAEQRRDAAQSFEDQPRPDAVKPKGRPGASQR